MRSLKLDPAAGKAMQLCDVYGTTCCSSNGKGLLTTKNGVQKLFGRVSEVLCNPPPKQSIYVTVPFCEGNILRPLL